MIAIIGVGIGVFCVVCTVVVMCALIVGSQYDKEMGQ